MRLVQTALALSLAVAAVAGASTAAAQSERHLGDRYAYGPSTPNSDGTEGYGSFSAMEGSSFVDGRRTVNHHNDGLTYPLDTARRAHRNPDYAYAPEAAAAPQPYDDRYAIDPAAAQPRRDR